jgi:hypothetical protein
MDPFLLVVSLFLISIGAPIFFAAWLQGYAAGGVRSRWPQLLLGGVALLTGGATMAAAIELQMYKQRWSLTELLPSTPT